MNPTVPKILPSEFYPSSISTPMALDSASGTLSGNKRSLEPVESTTNVSSNFFCHFAHIWLSGRLYHVHHHLGDFHASVLPAPEECVKTSEIFPHSYANEEKTYNKPSPWRPLSSIYLRWHNITTPVKRSRSCEQLRSALTPEEEDALCRDLFPDMFD